MFHGGGELRTTNREPRTENRELRTDILCLVMKDYDYKPMSTLALSGLWRLRIIAVLRYVDPCLGPPCRVMRPFSAECRPKCISVIA